MAVKHADIPEITKSLLKLVPEEKLEEALSALTKIKAYKSNSSFKTTVDRINKSFTRKAKRAVTKDKKPLSAKREGFWSEDNKPRSCKDEKWDQTAVARVLKRLTLLEENAKSAPADGDECWFCEKQVGKRVSSKRGWEWPSSLKHYVSRHNIRPTLEFRKFLKEQSDRLTNGRE